MPVFAMPSLGADMEAGTLVEWLVAPGDTVARGDIVAVVETQKGAIEIECFETGEVRRLLVEPGAKLPVGAPMAEIGAAKDAGAGTTGAARPATPPPPAAPPPVAAPSAPPVAPAAAAGLRASPAARALAAERGIDLATLTGSGPGGAIILTDVPKAGPTPVRSGMDLPAMRAAIAAAMTRAKREIPHYYVAQTIDLQPASDWLTAANAARLPDRRLLMGALTLRAAALAAAEVPELNGHYGADGFRPSAAVHAGLAVALRGGGLVAPAIRDANRLPLDDLMAAMRDLVMRARAGRLRSSEMTDGTITVSALGDSGPEAMTGVIFPPQVALVGLGAPQLRPWIVSGRVEPRRTLTVTLSADHRVSDGRRAARFLERFETLMQDPEAL